MIRSHNTFNFGKYRGCTVDEVARRDPSYIYFCENEIDMQFSPRVKRTAWESQFRPAKCFQKPMFL